MKTYFSFTFHPSLYATCCYPISQAQAHKFKNGYLFVAIAMVTSHFVCKYRKAAMWRAKPTWIGAVSGSYRKLWHFNFFETRIQWRWTWPFADRWQQRFCLRFWNSASLQMTSYQIFHELNISLRSESPAGTLRPSIIEITINIIDLYSFFTLIMRSTILESTPIYQLDRKQGLEVTLAMPTSAWTPIETVSIIQINRIWNSFTTLTII